MVILEDQTRLSEIGCRLRWITCIQIERMLSGLFPNMQILPFGSFVNGCGRYGCDLDMAVSLDGNSESHQSHGKSPLVFHAKAAINNPRLQTQKHIEILADILQNFTTGCTQVRCCRSYLRIFLLNRLFNCFRSSVYCKQECLS